MKGFRKQLSIPGLLMMVAKTFDRIKDPKLPRQRRFALSDCLKAGLAVFGLKCPSLLQFDRMGRDDVTVKHNLRTLYQLDQTPCDTYVRERLDEVEPHALRKPFKAILAAIQRGNMLERFQFLDDHYLLSVDGTGYFSSHKVHCKHCCTKKHRNGTMTYHHNMLGAVLVHPDHPQVLPMPPEPILNEDGHTKNDCERNAAKRLLTCVRREHPHMKLIVVEDSLASNGPHIKRLQDLDMRFILGAKPKDHTFLFNWVNTSKGTQTHTFVDDKGITHRFRYLNGVPLNDTHFDLEVNFLEYWEVDLKGHLKVHFTWVTDLPLTTDTVYHTMRGGRARWKIENETFNTLKNQGYHFKHNFGHGYNHLSTVFAYLMFLAFLIDQTQSLCCRLFRQAVKAAGRPLYFWDTLRGWFRFCPFKTWEQIYGAIRSPPEVFLLPGQNVWGVRLH